MKDVQVEHISIQKLNHGKITEEVDNVAVEEPLVLQLGGSCPTDMRTASAMARKIGFQEININAGCPSEKVSGSAFLYLVLVFVTLFSLISSPVCFIFLFLSQILFNSIFF